MSQAPNEHVNVVSGHSPLSSLVHRDPVTVPSEASLAQAVARMEAAGVSALLLEGGGIITERDLVRSLGRGAPLETTVGSIATLHPVIAPASLDVLDAGRLMLEQQVRHLVVDLGSGLAVISIRELAAVLLQETAPYLRHTAPRVAIDVSPDLYLG